MFDQQPSNFGINHRLRNIYHFGNESFALQVLSIINITTLNDHDVIALINNILSIYTQGECFILDDLWQKKCMNMYNT